MTHRDELCFERAGARVAARRGLVVLLLALGGLWEPSRAAEFFMPAPGDAVVGWRERVHARQEDTLVDIARGHNVGFQEIKLANPGVDTWLPGDGTEITIPNSYVLPDTPREGVVLNLAEMRLYYYPPEEDGPARRVISHPVSVGRQDWKTPLGVTRIVRKAQDPTWYPPESIREEHAADGKDLPEVVPPGPDNPLGRHALYLGIPGYLLHGTNRPYGIGMRVTHGCLRLYPEDVERLFELIPVGTPVRIVDQPYKFGWSDGVLYLEAHPPFEDPGREPTNLTPLMRSLLAATRDRPKHGVSWDRALEVALRADGMPWPVSASALEKLSDRLAGQDPAPDGPPP